MVATRIQQPNFVVEATPLAAELILLKGLEIDSRPVSLSVDQIQALLNPVQPLLDAADADFKPV